MPTTSLPRVALRWDTWWPQECQLHPYPGLPSDGHLMATGMPTTSLPRVVLRWDTWWPQECQLPPYPGLPSDGTPGGHRNANYIPTQGCPQMGHLMATGMPTTSLPRVALRWTPDWPQECQLHPYPGLPSDGHLAATGMPTTSLAGVALRWTPGGHRNANYIPTQGCPQMDTWRPQECQLHPYPGLPSDGHLMATGMPTTSLARVALRWTPDGHRNANYIPSRGCPQMDT